MLGFRCLKINSRLALLMERWLAILSWSSLLSITFKMSWSDITRFLIRKEKNRIREYSVARRLSKRSSSSFFFSFFLVAPLSSADELSSSPNSMSSSPSSLTGLIFSPPLEPKGCWRIISSLRASISSRLRSTGISIASSRTLLSLEYLRMKLSISFGVTSCNLSLLSQITGDTFNSFSMRSRRLRLPLVSVFIS